MKSQRSLIWFVFPLLALSVSATTAFGQNKIRSVRDRIRLLAAKEAVSKAIGARKSATDPDADVTERLRDAFLADVARHRTPRDSQAAAAQQVLRQIGEKLVRRRNDLLKQKNVQLQDLRRALPDLEALEKQAAEAYAARLVAEHHADARSAAVDRQRRSLKLKLDIPDQKAIDAESAPWVVVRSTLATKLAANAVSDPLFVENSRFVEAEAANVVALINSEYEQQRGIVEAKAAAIPDQLKTRQQLASWFGERLQAHVRARDEPRLETYEVFPSHAVSLQRRAREIEAARLEAYMRRCDLPELGDLKLEIESDVAAHQTLQDSLRRFKDTKLPGALDVLATEYADAAESGDAEIVEQFQKLAESNAIRRILSGRLEAQLRAALPTARTNVRDAQLGRHFKELSKWRPKEQLVVKLEPNSRLIPTEYGKALETARMQEPQSPLIEETELEVTRRIRGVIHRALDAFRSQRNEVEVFVKKNHGELRRDVESRKPKSEVAAIWQQRFVQDWQRRYKEPEFDLYQATMKYVYDGVSREYDDIVDLIKEEKKRRLAKIAEAKRKAEEMAKAAEEAAAPKPMDNPDPNDPAESAGESSVGDAGGGTLNGPFIGGGGPGIGGGSGGRGEGDGGEGEKENGGAGGGAGDIDIKLVVEDGLGASCVLGIHNTASRRVTFSSNSTVEAARSIAEHLDRVFKEEVARKLRESPPTAGNNDKKAKTPFRIHLSVKSQTFRALTGVHVERELRKRFKTFDSEKRLDFKWSVGP